MRKSCCNLTNDLFLPTIMFTALGGMTWAVRGCSGFGAVPGCIFAGVMWGTAWWYLAYEPKGEQTRRYSSAWIVLAVTLGVGISGGRGWMQWPSFFEGRLDTNVGKGEFVPISTFYGFLWLFIAGVPWAGLGACTLAWCGSIKETRVFHWVGRIGCGIGTARCRSHGLYDGRTSALSGHAGVVCIILQQGYVVHNLPRSSLVVSKKVWESITFEVKVGIPICLASRD